MHFDYAEAFHKTIPDAYERLLLNAMLGDAALFARDLFSARMGCQIYQPQYGMDLAALCVRRPAGGA